MKFRIGFRGIETDLGFRQIIEKVFAPFAEIRDLGGPKDVERFLAEKGRADACILVTSEDIPADYKTLWSLIHTSLEDPVFHLLFLYSRKSPERLLGIANQLQIHLVNKGDEGAKDAFTHHCYAIKTQLEHLWLKRRFMDMLDYYEDVYSGEVQHKQRVRKFVQRVRDVLGAESVSVFLLNPASNEFVSESYAGDGSPKAVPAAGIRELFEFRDACVTSTLSESQAVSLLKQKGLGEKLSGTVVLATFRLYRLPGLILYLFGRKRHDTLLWDACNFASREIFHLLRSKELRSQYQTLNSLVKVENLHLGRPKAVWQILKPLKDHFGAEGVSILEVKEREGNRLILLKTFIHYEGKDVDTFPADEGLGHHSISRNKAMLITDIVEQDAVPWALGLEFDPNCLEVDEGKRVKIRAIVPPGSVEKERSVIYFPLNEEGETFATVKVALFSRPSGFGLSDLRALSVFAEPIGSLLRNLRSIEELRKELANKQLQENMVQRGEALLFYREITLGVFHQLAHHLNRLNLTMPLIEDLFEASGHETPQVKELIDRCKKQVKDAKALIDDAKTRGQQLKPLLKECYLVADVVRPILERLRKRIEGTNISVRATLTDSDFSVLLDPKLASESLTNILDNAIWAIKEHRGAGKKEIFFAVRQVPGENRVRIEITDSGVGMDEERRNRVRKFEAFHTTKEGGTGLGLFFARRIFEYCDGRIDIPWSQPGKGTTVEIVLPTAGGAK